MDNGFNLLSCRIFKPGVESEEISALYGAELQHYGYKEAAKALGRKGMRFKDEATLLALVTAQKVLEAAPELSVQEKDRTAIIVTSNLGNVDTVVNNAKVIASSHVNDTSAMDLPNASSNSVSASISIVNQLRGPNLMLCNGPSSGEDALQLATDLIQARRADRVLVIGVEVVNEVVEQYIAPATSRFHGAGGYLIERGDVPRQQKPVASIIPADTDTPELIVSDDEINLVCGDASGATGVLKVKLASEYAQKREPRCIQVAEQSWMVSADA